MTIIGLDPGTTHTGWVIVTDGKIVDAGKSENIFVSEILSAAPDHIEGELHVACEDIRGYGRAVGKETFQTKHNIGEFAHICKVNDVPFFLYSKNEYGPQITGTRQCQDKTIRRALALRFGGYDKGQPLHMLKGDSDRRSAFAVAVYHGDQWGGI